LQVLKKTVSHSNRCRFHSKKTLALESYHINILQLDAHFFFKYKHPVFARAKVVETTFFGNGSFNNLNRDNPISTAAKFVENSPRDIFKFLRFGKFCDF